MGRFIILLLGFCTLHLASVSRTSVEASVTPWMTNDTRCSIFTFSGFYIDRPTLGLYIFFKSNRTGAEIIIWFLCWIRWSGRRTIRSADRPKPISCKMGIWSSWTRCDSCTESKVMMLLFFF